MSGIVLSASVRQNLLSLQSTASLLATTQNDLATGKKVNSALDNPTNYFTAQSLDNRASDISNLLDGIGNGVQVLQAANTGITSLQSLISNAQVDRQPGAADLGRLFDQVQRHGCDDHRRDRANLLGTANTTVTGAADSDERLHCVPTISRHDDAVGSVRRDRAPLLTTGNTLTSSTARPSRSTAARAPTGSNQHQRRRHRRHAARQDRRPDRRDHGVLDVSRRRSSSSIPAARRT